MSEESGQATTPPPRPHRRRRYTWLRRALGAIFAVSVLAGLGLAGVAWRLAQGPLDVPMLAARIEAAANIPGEPKRLEVGRATIAWAGWRRGQASPFTIVLNRVVARDAEGAARIDLPEAAVTLSLPSLLAGRFAPRTIELRGPLLRALRDTDGTWSLQLGEVTTEAAVDAQGEPPFSAAALFADLMEPASELSLGGALRSVRVTDGVLLVVDRALDRTWRAEQVGIALARHDVGGFGGQGRALLRLGEEAVPVTARIEAESSPRQLGIGLTLPMVQPAALARAIPLLRPLATLDAPTTFEVEALFDGEGHPLEVDARLRTGAGSIGLGEGRVAIASLVAALHLEDDRARLGPARLRLAGEDAPEIWIEGSAARDDGRWRGGVDLRLDRLSFDALGRYWPEQLAPGARRWLVENITAGVARDGRWRLEGEAGASLADARLTGFSGEVAADGLTVHWLRPIPPVENGTATARFGRDAVTVEVTAGRQAQTTATVRAAELQFRNLLAGPEVLSMEMQLAGPLADIMGVLRHPRLRLFERSAVPVPALTGTVPEARMTLTLPLVEEPPIEDVRVTAQARLEQVRVPAALLGHDIERGGFDVTVDNAGLRLSGQAMIVEVPARLEVEMDFRQGNAAQTVLRERLVAAVPAAKLAAFGLDATGIASGPIGLDARQVTQRNGLSRLTLRTDLRETALALPVLGWSKAPGVPARGEAALRLRRGELEAVESLRMEAPQGLLRARTLTVANGLPERIEVQEARFGASQFAGEVRWPHSPGAAWEMSLGGGVLDLGALMDAPDTDAAEDSAAYGIELRFARLLLGQGRELGDIAVRARADARGVLREAQASGRAGSGRFELAVTPQGGRRELSLTSTDAGALLRALDVLRTLDGGQLQVTGTYDSNRPGSVLAGRAEMQDFAVRDPTTLGKLLQAMTLYGLFEAAAGPGLGFRRLVAPFRLSPAVLEFDDARAFSASLGVTAQGQLRRRERTVDIRGTIVPAYFFNALLGNIPLLGRIFSPERGGGLFAATFRLRGPLADPQVAVNPLAALTPGFLRGIFGLGNGSGAPNVAAPTGPSN